MHDEPEEAGVAETPKNVRVTVKADASEVFAQINETMQNIAKGFGETIGPAFASMKESLSKVTFPSFEEELTQAMITPYPGITPIQLAKAFDVPPSVLGLDPIPTPDLSWMHDHEHPVAHLVSTGEPGKYKLVNGPAEPPKIPEGEPLTFEVSAPWLTPGTKSYLDQYVNAQVKAQMLAEEQQLLDQLEPFHPQPWSSPSSDPLGDIQKVIEHYKQKPASMSFSMDQINPELVKLIMGADGPIHLATDGTFDGPIVASGGWTAPPSEKIYGGPPSNHASGLAMDFNAPVGKPIPGQMYLEGDGDPFEHKVKPSYMVFDVLGKANPVVASSPTVKTWKTELGQIDQSGGQIQVSLLGTVSTGQGAHQLGAQLIVTDLEMAKKLIGVIPNEGPGTGVCVLEQAAGDQLFTWEAGTGWIPKLPDQPFYAAFPKVSVAKGGIKFPTYEKTTVHGKEYEHPAGMPPQHPADGTQHIGPDDAVWEFHLAGGWRIVEDTASPINRAPYGWWCSFCGEHMTEHKGDPVACDSGGWCRPATSAEHKLTMMRAAG